MPFRPHSDGSGAKRDVCMRVATVTLHAVFAGIVCVLRWKCSTDVVWVAPVPSWFVAPFARPPAVEVHVLLAVNRKEDKLVPQGVKILIGKSSSCKGTFRAMCGLSGPGVFPDAPHYSVPFVHVF